jgi:3-hydroxybutyryl-CoA dehydrogenase
MRVVVIGAGLMGAQIGVEYALGGHEITLVARNTNRALERAEAALDLVLTHRLRAENEIDAARERLTVTSDPASDDWNLVVESVPEDMGLKARLLRPLAAGSPEAIIASNTSSLSITELGERVGAPERAVVTHYWNPPLLMPLVEVVAGERTAPENIERVGEILRALGKRPVAVERDVAGFVWNRLQMAVLREALWLVENGVASPDAVDEVLTYGLARRWRHVGFFRAIALGGVDTWQRSAANLVPEISRADEIGDLRRWVHESGGLAEVARRRDRGLAEDLIRDREETGEPS